MTQIFETRHVRVVHAVYETALSTLEDHTVAPPRLIGRFASRQAAEDWLRENRFLPHHENQGVWHRHPLFRVHVQTVHEPVSISEAEAEDQVRPPSDPG